MARDTSAPQSSPLWSRRLTEWSIVALVLVALMWAFEHEARVVQGQSEKIVVWSTLSALRAAVLIDQLTQHVRPTNSGPVQKNPFLLLQRLPANYAGERAMRDMYLVAPGSWVFDAGCGCVGYRLLYPQWLEPAQETGAIWFRLAVADGEVRLEPQGQYLWFGQPLI